MVKSRRYTCRRVESHSKQMFHERVLAIFNGGYKKSKFYEPVCGWEQVPEFSVL